MGAFSKFENIEQKNPDIRLKTVPLFSKIVLMSPLPCCDFKFRISEIYAASWLTISYHSPPLARTLEACGIRAKGQLISKCPFDVIVSTKNNNKIFLKISALAQRYTYRVLQAIQMKLILLCVWAEPAVLGSTKTALKFKYEI